MPIAAARYTNIAWNKISDAVSSTSRKLRMVVRAEGTRFYFDTAKIAARNAAH